MPGLIMTLGRQSKRFVLRGRTETLTPDFREISFPCDFVADAVNGAPKIRVSVGEVGVGKPKQIRIEIIPPVTTGAGGVVSGDVAISEVVIATAGEAPTITGSGLSVVADTELVISPDAAGIADVAGAAAADVGTLTSGTAATAGTGGGSTPPGTSALIDDGVGPRTGIDGTAGDLVFEDPFGPLDPFPPFDPPGGGGGGGGGPIREIVERDLVAGTDRAGRWTVRLHNLADDARDFLIDVHYPETVQHLSETRVPFQLVNRAFSEALLLMSPRLTVNGGKARVSFTSDFKKLAGIDDIVSNVDGRLKDINLESLTVRLGRESAFQNPAIIVGLELEELRSEIDVFGPNGNITNMSMELDLVINLVAPPISDLFRTALIRDNGTFRPRQMNVLAEIKTNPQLKGKWIKVLTFLKDVFGGDSFDTVVRDMVTKAKGSLNRAMHEGGTAFLQDVIVHMVERDHALHSIRASATELIVEHHAYPDRFGRSVFTGGTGTLSTEPASSGGGPSGTGDISTGGGIAAPLFAAPRDFAADLRGDGRTAESSFGPRLPELPDLPEPDASAADLVAEGQIDHIVFLMMENRSFDHMLGYRALKGHDVRGLTGNEENTIPDGNRPYRAKHTTKTKGIPSPGHHFDDTEQQVADGSMTGFATNYLKRNGVTDPGLIMSFYTEAELPMYEFIANNFAICDAWHSAHPGPTWPNRFCATTGETPEVENFDITDERIGYFKGTSIFDMLSRFGVDWCYAEGNVSFLRMFDRYRLDIRNVIPFTDDFDHGIDDTWVNRVKAGRLPSVSYIDPRFIDIPPAFDANDDLPPTDVCHGQQLVKRIYELLSEAPTWSRTLFVVTYDEHGGFFDHVPPPGTPLSEDSSPQPMVHPDGADHLGVRVPALVISPWVDAGTVITETFDHTSIIKTILQRFAPDEHAGGAAFGPRTEAANSLLDIELLRESARTDKPTAPNFDCRHDIRTSRGPAAAIERDDFHTGMRFLGLPQAQRADLVR